MEAYPQDKLFAAGSHPTVNIGW